MANLPVKTTLTSPTTTESQFQGGIGALFDFIEQLYPGVASTPISIASDTLTPTTTFHIIDTEGSLSSDDLKFILTTNIGLTKTLILKIASGSRPVTLKHNISGSGKILLRNSADLVMDNTNYTIALTYSSTQSAWVELYRNWGIYLPTTTSKTQARTELGLGSAAISNTGDFATPTDITNVTNLINSRAPINQATTVDANSNITYTFVQANAAWHKVIVTSSCTFAFTFPASTVCGMILEVQGGSAYTITWPVGVKFADGTAPTLSNGIDHIAVYSDATGQIYINMIASGVATL